MINAKNIMLLVGLSCISTVSAMNPDPQRIDLNCARPEEQLEAASRRTTVTFKPSTQGISDVTKTILCTIPKPNIVIWYSGENGLTERCAKFYQTKLISTLKQQPAINKKETPKPFNLFLYDLSAWSGLRDTNRSLVGTRVNCDGLASWEFFQWLNCLSPEQCVIVRTILTRSFIWQKSITYAPNGVTLSQIPNYPPVLQPWQEVDSAQIYSALQYLEGIFIVQKIAQQSSNQNIVFLLPGDEYSYFQDPCLGNSCTAFQEDVRLLVPDSTQIFFCSFEYTYTYVDEMRQNRLCARPYLTVNGDTTILAPESVS